MSIMIDVNIVLSQPVHDTFCLSVIRNPSKICLFAIGNKLKLYDLIFFQFICCMHSVVA